MIVVRVETLHLQDGGMKLGRLWKVGRRLNADRRCRLSIDLFRRFTAIPFWRGASFSAL